MVQDKQGHSLEFKDLFDEDAENLYWEYFCPEEGKRVIITESKGKEEKEDKGDFVKQKKRPCSDCGEEMELCSDCFVHHHVANFMDEHNRYQKMIHPMRQMTPEEEAFKEKYGTLFPHPKDLLPEDRPQDAGPQGHFYGDAEWYPQGSVEPKSEEEAMPPQTTASVRPYQLTQAEFDAITKEAWEENCVECLDTLQSIEEKDGEHNLYPTYYQADHLRELFGYEVKPSEADTGYLDPESPEWGKSVEHIQDYQKNPEKGGAFGPQSGMTRGEPTRDEWQITSYLDQLGVSYVHKMKIGELDPTDPKPKIEYDIYIPDYLMAIETSPGWHEGGPNASNFPQVVENDRYKRNFAKEHGIDLEAFDPAHGTEKFINEVLVPKLRAVGVDAFEVPMPEEKKKGKEETKGYGLSSKDRTCPKCGSTETTPLNQAETQWRCTKCRAWFDSETDWESFSKSEEGQGIYHQKALDWMYSNLKDEGDGVIICKICDWGFVYPSEEELIDHFATRGHGPDSPQSTDDRLFDLFTLGEEKEEEEGRWDDKEKEMDKNTPKELTPNELDRIFGSEPKSKSYPSKPTEEDWNRIIKPEEEQYVNIECPYCHEPFIYQEIGKHVSSKHPEFKAKQNEFQRGNPFNQQYIYREAGYDWDYNVKYRKKPILEEQEKVDRYVYWTDEPYEQKSTKDTEDNPICMSCSEGRHPHEDSDCKVIIPEGQCCCMFGVGKEEQSPSVNQNIPTGKYTPVEPLVLDQSQNVPRFPERGKVNEITQEGEGEELEATNNLFLEQEEEDRYECSCQKCECHRPLAEPGRCGYCASGDHNPTPRKKEGEQERVPTVEQLLALIDQGGEIITDAVGAGELNRVEGEALLEYAARIKETVQTYGPNQESIDMTTKMMELIQKKMATPISPINV